MRNDAPLSRSSSGRRIERGKRAAAAAEEEEEEEEEEDAPDQLVGTRMERGGALEAASHR